MKSSYYQSSFGNAFPPIVTYRTPCFEFSWKQNLLCLFLEEMNQLHARDQTKCSRQNWILRSPSVSSCHQSFPLELSLKLYGTRYSLDLTGSTTLRLLAGGVVWDCLLRLESW